MAHTKKAKTLDELITEDMKAPRFRAKVASRLADIQLEQMIAQVRSRAGMSQAALAAQLGRTQPWIARVEKRPAGNMQISTYAKIVGATGGSVQITVRDRSGKKVGAVDLKNELRA